MIICTCFSRTITELGRTVQHSPLARVAIRAIPDDTLLEIFKFYVDHIYHEVALFRSKWYQTVHHMVKDIVAWHTLVHVCRKWRYVVFDSPRWLHLELLCTNRSPAKKMLVVRPALPIFINVANGGRCQWPGVTNVISALKRHDLVCRIRILGVPNSLLKSSAIKKQFPMLTDLTLHSYEDYEDNAPAIPDLFLGGSAPRLRSLEFAGIPFLFPALGRLLLSATDLVTFRLLDLPNSGYRDISPELLATNLSVLTKLQELSIDFRYPRSRADRERRHPPLLKRLVLPSLNEFSFKGNSEYLEDVVDRIDAPALDRVTITFFNQLVFDTPLLRDFVRRTEVFQESHRADVSFAGFHIELTLSRRGGVKNHHTLVVQISSRAIDWQLSSLARFCSTSITPLPTLEYLSIHTGPLWWKASIDGMDNAQWLELLHPFVTEGPGLIRVLSSACCARPGRTH